MNGKLKKMGFALSGLMCAGLLFSSVLTSEARDGESEAECKHPAWEKVNEYTEYESRGHSIHDIYDVTEYECRSCGEKTKVYDKTGSEDHDLTEYWDSDKNCWVEECGYCDYTYEYR